MKNFILFDFDGVIVDSFCIAFETRKLLCPDITENQCRRCFEGNVNDWESSFNIHTDACQHNAVEFDPLYKKRLKTEARIVPGIEAEIAKLEKEYRLLVVSSSISSAIREFLEDHRLANRFVDILGKEVHKSKVEKIKMIFQKYETAADDCIFITDTLGDIREATQVGVSSIGVTWGFHTPETLQQGNPFRLVEHQEKLSPAVSDYFQEKLI